MSTDSTGFSHGMSNNHPNNHHHNHHSRSVHHNENNPIYDIHKKLSLLSDHTLSEEEILMNYGTFSPSTTETLPGNQRPNEITPNLLTVPENITNFAYPKVFTETFIRVLYHPLRSIYYSLRYPRNRHHQRQPRRNFFSFLTLFFSCNFFALLFFVALFGLVHLFSWIAVHSTESLYPAAGIRSSALPPTVLYPFFLSNPSSATVISDILYPTVLIDAEKYGLLHLLRTKPSNTSLRSGYTVDEIYQYLVQYYPSAPMVTHSSSSSKIVSLHRIEIWLTILEDYGYCSRTTTTIINSRKKRDDDTIIVPLSLFVANTGKYLYYYYDLWLNSLVYLKNYIRNNYNDNDNNNYMTQPQKTTVTGDTNKPFAIQSKVYWTTGYRNTLSASAVLQAFIVTNTTVNNTVHLSSSSSWWSTDTALSLFNVMNDDTLPSHFPFRHLHTVSTPSLTWKEDIINRYHDSVAILTKGIDSYFQHHYNISLLTTWWFSDPLFSSEFLPRKKINSVRSVTLMGIGDIHTYRLLDTMIHTYTSVRNITKDKSLRYIHIFSNDTGIDPRGTIDKKGKTNSKTTTSTSSIKIVYASIDNIDADIALPVIQKSTIIILRNEYDNYQPDHNNNSSSNNLSFVRSSPPVLEGFVSFSLSLEDSILIQRLWNIRTAVRSNPAITLLLMQPIPSDYGIPSLVYRLWCYRMYTEGTTTEEFVSSTARSGYSSAPRKNVSIQNDSSENRVPLSLLRILDRTTDQWNELFDLSGWKLRTIVTVPYNSGNDNNFVPYPEGEEEVIVNLKKKKDSILPPTGREKYIHLKDRKLLSSNGLGIYVLKPN